MQAWQKEIQKDYDDRKASVVWALTDGNDIEKGIASDLQYSNSELSKVKKKGSEIKEKLNTEKSKVAIKLAEVNLIKKALKKEIGFEPDGDEEMEGCKRYSYKQMYPTNQDVDSQPTNEATETMSPQIKLMREYNSCLYRYKHCKKELGTLDTLLNSIQDKKEYELNLKIATELGF